MSNLAAFEADVTQAEMIRQGAIAAAQAAALSAENSGERHSAACRRGGALAGSWLA
jgi:hypothetical protein